LIFSEVEVGSYLLTGRFVPFDVEQARATGASGFAQQLVVGSLAVGAGLALFGFGLAWLIASRRSERETLDVNAATETEQALERTRARYAGVRPADRYYVAGKLAFDPVFGLVAGLSGSFGRVLDVGCGRGQLGLFLHELGRASEVTGFDSDARKVDVARSAFPEARFVVGDAAQLELPAADTILLVDVLHYLPLAEQDALLAAATRAVTPGGRVLVRELDADPSARSAVTRLFEWFGQKIGLNRGRATHYRAASELTKLLERAGLPCRVEGASERTPFNNVLIVAGAELLRPADA
jgi:SAM-dependent methyltransferase